MTSHELALRGALLVLRNGGSTSMASQAYADLLAGFGEERAEPIWRLDFVVAPVPGGKVLIEPVGPIGSNLARVSAALQLVAGFARGAITADVLEKGIGAIEMRPLPYGSAVRAVVGAIGGATFARSIGGDLGSMAIAGAAAGCGQLFRLELLQRRGLPAMAEIAVGALFSALLAGVGMHTGATSNLPPTLVASVVCFVPGLMLINGFVDLLTYEHLIIGLQRILYALSIFVALAIAIAFALILAP